MTAKTLNGKMCRNRSTYTQIFPVHYLNRMKPYYINIEEKIKNKNKWECMIKPNSVFMQEYTHLHNGVDNIIILINEFKL